MAGFTACISASKAVLSGYFGFRLGAGAGSGAAGLGAAVSTGFPICGVAACGAGAVVPGAGACVGDAAAPGGALRSEQAPSASASMSIDFVYFMILSFATDRCSHGFPRHRIVKTVSLDHSETSDYTLTRTGTRRRAAFDATYQTMSDAEIHRQFRGRPIVELAARSSFQGSDRAHAPGVFSGEEFV